MIRFIIARPIAVIMLFIAAIVLGVISYRSIAVSLMPDIPIPEVTVTVSAKNNSARELENTVVNPLRLSLLQVSHLSDIKSETRDGFAVIKISFDYGTDINYAFIEVNEKVDGLMNVFPREMERPKVIKASATDIPVFYLNLSLKNSSQEKNSSSLDSLNYRFIDLSNFAESVIRKRLEQLPEVAMVDMSGTLKPQVTIEPDVAKMKSLNMSIEQLDAAIHKNNVSPGNILINDGHYRYTIQFSGVLRTCTDVANIYLKHNGLLLQLKDVAKVYIEPQKAAGMYLSNGQPAIAMAVIKQADAQLADMKEKIRELAHTFEKDYPDIQFEISQDQTQLLDYSISNLKQNLGQGLLLVIVVVFLFLKDFKSPMLIGLTLLVSMVICMLFFRIAGLSINIISLAGLLLAVGNMIDNSIIVTDNISQYIERGLTTTEACIKGTREVMIPMLSSLLTNVAVFFPMILLSGIAGALMYDEALSVIIGLGVSYLTGIFLMPVLYNLAYSSIYQSPLQLTRKFQSGLERISNYTKRFFDLEKTYKAGLQFTFRKKGLNLLFYLSILPLGFIFLTIIRKEKMPLFSQTELTLYIDWNENINLPENNSRIANMLLPASHLIQQSNVFIGHQQFLLQSDQKLSASEVQIYLKAKNTQDLEIITEKLKTHLQSNYKSVQYKISAPVSIFEKLFSSSEPPIVAEVSMNQKDEEWNISELSALQTSFELNKSLTCRSDLPLNEKIVLDIDMEKLLLYNVQYDKLINELKTAFKENSIGTLRSFQHYLPLVIASDEKGLYQIISQLSVTNQSGEQIPIKHFVEIRQENTLKTLFAGKEGEYIPFDFYPRNRDEETKTIQTVNSETRKKNSFSVVFSGSAFSSMKLLKEMGIILFISLLLLYFILAAQFESLIQPLIVLLELPIDIAGALILLCFTGQSLNLMSAIGIIIMCGIIINDSILKLDVINQLRREGMPLLEAIQEGGHRRLRAIIMTSLTSILAMLPLLFTNDIGSELQKPFSYALIGGMFVGTIVSLYLVPLVYYLIYRKSAKNIL